MRITTTGNGANYYYLVKKKEKEKNGANSFVLKYSPKKSSTIIACP